MKVNIAVQTLSSSVAKAIDHLRDDRNLEDFQGSQATCKFIRFFDKLFDMLNAKNPFAKGLKAPLAKWNMDRWQKFLGEEAPEYLMSLQEMSGKPIISGRRSQALLGFLVTIKSTLCLANELVGTGKLEYLLPYKFSQDHIEMFFSKIRQRNGNNNNPSSEQFRSALRTLMLHNAVTPSPFANVSTFCEDESLGLAIGAKPYKDSTPSPLPMDHDLAEAAGWLEVKACFFKTQTGGSPA